MHQKMEVKVNMHCVRCRTEVLKSVTKLLGIEEVSVDLEKQMLVVVGDVDPVKVVKRIKKTGKRAEIITVGPPAKPKPYSPIGDSIQIVYPDPIYTDAFSTVVGYQQPCQCETGGCVIL
ncbi:putative heavy metal-associated domain, HMA, heavy metal-associated domain superfamily [Helianthus debilis subsp. tardiflorus]